MVTEVGSSRDPRPDEEPPTEPDDTGPLAQRTGTNVLWMAAQKGLTRVGGLITIIVLTRMLSPEDFGVAAAASSLMPLIFVLSDAGFSSYIIQARRVTQRMLSTAFWFCLIAGFCLAAIIFGISRPIADLLNRPELTVILRVMTISILFIAVGAVPLALIRRKMAFRSLAIMEVVAYLTSQVVAITIALLGGGAWALVLQLIVTQVVTTVWVVLGARWRPGLEFSLDQFVVMGTFGIQVVGSGLVIVAATWAETVIIGAGLGVKELGYLNIAQRLVQIAYDVAASAILPVTMVAFAKVRYSGSRLRSAYLRSSSISSAAIAPVMIFVAVSADELVPLLFGQSKMASAQIVPPLALVAFLNLGVLIDQAIHLGAGRPGRWFWFVFVAYTGAVTITLVATDYGLITLVHVWIGTASAMAIARSGLVGRLIGAPARRVATAILGLILPGLLSFVAGMAALRFTERAWPILALAICGISVLAVYLLVMRMIRPAALADVLSVFPQRLTNRLSQVLHRAPADSSE